MGKSQIYWEILEQRLTKGWETNREVLLSCSLILSSFCWASAIIHCRISKRIFILVNDPVLTAPVMSSGDSWLQSSALPHAYCVTSFSFLPSWENRNQSIFHPLSGLKPAYSRLGKCLQMQRGCVCWCPVLPWSQVLLMNLDLRRPGCHGPTADTGDSGGAAPGHSFPRGQVHGRGKAWSSTPALLWEQQGAVRVGSK